MNSDEELIIKVFNNMNFENKSTSENSHALITADIKKILNSDCLLLRVPFVEAVDRATKALKEWKEFSGLLRSNILNNVWKALKDKSDELSGLKYNLSLLADYFDFYSDLATHTEKLSAEPVGVVLLVLPPHPCFFILGATVSAALAAGCSVIVHTEHDMIPLFLNTILLKAGLPHGTYNVVTEPLTFYDKVPQNIQKIIYCGSFAVAQDFYFEKGFESFKFVCLKNTAAFVLESSDLNAAVSNIVQKTWGEASFWAASTVVVQESIIQEFLDTLKFQMEQFLNTNDVELKFKDKEISEKILIAVKDGAVLVQASCKENEWGPIALVNYQNQEDLPLLKILVCRTSKEGVKLLNNFYSTLGTSIWSESSVQALEIASQLESPNIWINCHGIVEAKVPLLLSRLSGNFALGGRQGILEYLSTGDRKRIKIRQYQKTSQRLEVLQVVLSAKKAFDLWHINKTKKKYLKALADELVRIEKFSKVYQFFTYLSSFLNYPHHSEKNFTEEFFILYEEVPIGVISLFISCEADIEPLTFLIALSVALGNAVILVMEHDNPFVTDLIDIFNKRIQKNIVTAVYGNETGLYLASDPNVQAMWIYDENVSTLQELRKESSKNLKHLWVIPKVTFQCEELFLMQCIRHKTIWLPKVEKFP